MTRYGKYRSYHMRVKDHILMNMSNLTTGEVVFMYIMSHQVKSYVALKQFKHNKTYIFVSSVLRSISHIHKN